MHSVPSQSSVAQVHRHHQQAHAQRPGKAESAPDPASPFSMLLDATAPADTTAPDQPAPQPNGRPQARKATERSGEETKAPAVGKTEKPRAAADPVPGSKPDTVEAGQPQTEAEQAAVAEAVLDTAPEDAEKPEDKAIAATAAEASVAVAQAPVVALVAALTDGSQPGKDVDHADASATDAPHPAQKLPSGSNLPEIKEPQGILPQEQSADPKGDDPAAATNAGSKETKAGVANRDEIRTEPGHPQKQKPDAAARSGADAIDVAADRALQTGDAASGAKTGTHPLQNLGLTATGTHTQAAANTNPTAAAAPNSVAVPLAGVAVEITAQARAGKNRFEIRLDPPELGRIDVRLDVDKHGQVSSRLVVDRAETLDLLRRDAAGLERALQDAGLKTSDNGLQFSLRDQHAGGNDRHQGAGHLVVADEEASVIDTSRGYGRWLTARGGIDIRV